MMKKRKHLYVSVLLILLILTVLLNLAACLPAFCDWYGDHVYGLLADGISRLTAPVPAAVGEIVMYIAAAFALFAVIFLILLLFLRKKQGYRKFCGGYFKTLAMILVCGLMFLVAWLVQRRGKRSACHRRYLEYRTLAEGLRVQAFLRYAGSELLVSDILSWSEQAESGWIAAALKAAVIGAKPYGVHGIREPWVEQQRQYHSRAAQKAKRAFLTSNRIVKTALWISIALYLSVLVFELIWGDLLPFGAGVSDADRYRMLTKLLLGGVSAATLFISNYYGRLSLSRVTSDCEKMERFYAAVSNRIDRNGQTDDLLLLLAREELVENGNWCSYQRDNSADLSI